MSAAAADRSGAPCRLAFILSGALLKHRRALGKYRHAQQKKRSPLMVNAVILNDTRGDNHFGCFRVMRIIEENLARRGIIVTAKSLVRNDWERDRGFLDRFADADLVVINGEGTLHHGHRQGERLLKVAEHPLRGGKPVALINTIYQQNPVDWRRYLDRIDLISARDSKSAAEISHLTGRNCGMVPDLSLAEGATVAPGIARTRLLIGDSVDTDTRKALLALADADPSARFLPILRGLKPSKPHHPTPLRQLREAYVWLNARYSQFRRGNIEFNNDEAGFIRSLESARLHVTGRFHAVCFCLFTGTPFLAVESNSWKMGALLEDFGIGTGRIVPVDTIKARLASAENLAFSSDEKAKIAAGLDRCRQGATDLFDRIAALVAEKA
jgi:hypothetical protein